MKTRIHLTALVAGMLASIALLTALPTQAAPARPQPITIIQPDGSILTIRLHGDEWCHWTTDLDGNLLVTDDQEVFTVRGRKVRRATVTLTPEAEVE